MKMLKRGLLIFCIIVLLGFLFNLLAFLLPQNLIHQNILASIGSFRKEGQSPRLIEGYSATALDNNSDAWILLMCDYDGDHNLIEKALGGYYHTYPSESGYMTGMRNLLASSEAQPSGIASYGRYWHGWLFPIRLCLVFMSYSGIRMLNMILQFLLTVTCFTLLERRKLFRYSFAFAIAILTLVPVVTAISFEYSFVYCIFMAGVAAILAFHEKIRDMLGYPIFFMLLGMLTSYFDFLTYPLLTLGMPLTCLLLLEENRTMRTIALCSCMWGIGYGGMWGAKWILSSLFTQENVIKDAIDRILVRASHTNGVSSVGGERLTYWPTVRYNLGMVCNVPFIILFASGIGYYMFQIRKTISKRILHLKAAMPFWLLAAFPFAWWFLLMNHSFLHKHFTYRIIALTVFAGLCGVQKLEQKNFGNQL